MVNTEGTLNLARQAAQAASRPAAARLPSSRQFQNTHRQAAPATAPAGPWVSPRPDGIV